jgi:hypothetical protein
MSSVVSVAWSHCVLSYYCTKHGQRHGVALSGCICTITMSRSGQLGRRHIVAACPHVLQVMMGQVLGVSEICGRALETREPSRITRVAKSFFILGVCGPQRSMRHVVAS